MHKQLHMDLGADHHLHLQAASMAADNAPDAHAVYFEVSGILRALATVTELSSFLSSSVSPTLALR